MTRQQFELRVSQNGRVCVVELHTDLVRAKLEARRYIHRDPAAQIFDIAIFDLRRDIGEQTVWQYGPQEAQTP